MMNKSIPHTLELILVHKFVRVVCLHSTYHRYYVYVCYFLYIDPLPLSVNETPQSARPRVNFTHLRLL
jgi:hypothetical protein